MDGLRSRRGKREANDCPPDDENDVNEVLKNMDAGDGTVRADLTAIQRVDEDEDDFSGPVNRGRMLDARRQDSSQPPCSALRDEVTSQMSGPQTSWTQRYQGVERTGDSGRFMEAGAGVKMFASASTQLPRASQLSGDPMGEFGAPVGISQSPQNGGPTRRQWGIPEDEGKDVDVGVGARSKIPKSPQKGGSTRRQGGIFMTEDEFQRSIDKAVQRALDARERAENESNDRKNLNQPKTFETDARGSRPGEIVEDSSDHSSDDDNDDEYHDAEEAVDVRRSRARLPPFRGNEGTETWQVWYNRFADIADKRKWSNEKKLDEIIPLLQGDAGDFVWGQLGRSTRRCFRKLIRELDARFRKIEVKKTYGAIFSRRVQGDETVQEFSADLKRLYDKAYPNRDRETRTEDLLRKFFDGLEDEDASFQVEYVKDPQDIDEAVSEIITYMEARRKPTEEPKGKKPKRPVRAVKEGTEGRAARTQDGKARENSCRSTTVQGAENSDGCLSEIKALVKAMSDQYNAVNARLAEQERQQQPKSGPNTQGAKTMNSNQPHNGNGRNNRRNNGCYQCGAPDHFYRQCPNRRTGFPSSAPLNLMNQNFSQPQNRGN